jgi:hypothetical protein
MGVFINGLVQPLHQLGLVIGLFHRNFETKLIAPGGGSAYQIGHGGGAIDFGFPYP